MMGKLIQWDELYCFQKFLPLLTRWQLFHICDGSENVTLRGSVQPDFIKKKRTPKGVPSYEIIWKDEQGCFDCLIPDAQLRMFYTTNKEKTESEALNLLWSTIEPIDLVEKAYPDLVTQFEESKAKGKAKKSKKTQETTKATKSQKAKSTDVDDVDAVDENVNPINVIKTTTTTMKKTTQKATRPVGAKSRKKKDENVRPIDLFFRKDQAKSTAYASPKIKTSTKPMNLSAFSIDFNDSLGLLDNDDMNLSVIINEMVTRPPDVTEYKGKKLRFDEITSKQHESSDSVDVDENGKGQANTERTADDSVDDFDLIVMRKGRKSFIDQKKLIFSRESSQDRPNECSTPVLPRRLTAIIPSSSKQSFDADASLDLSSSKNRKNSMISSSFFAVNPDDEVDLFEKSIDFRNMQDDDESEETEETDSKAESEQSHASLDDDDEINKYDTFDRLVGIN